MWAVLSCRPVVAGLAGTDTLPATAGAAIGQAAVRPCGSPQLSDGGWLVGRLGAGHEDARLRTREGTRCCRARRWVGDAPPETVLGVPAPERSVVRAFVDAVLALS